MSAYSDYFNQVRRLLHDANGQFWGDTEILDYINAGRVRTVRDTGSYRNLQNINLVASQEVYAFTVFGITPVIDVVNITVRWGSSRVVLGYVPWSKFNAKLRYYMTNVGRPTYFSVYSYNSFYLQQVPDQAYVAECDTVVEPPPIVDTTTVEVIPLPFTTAPQYWAAHLAKVKEQSWGEADAFAKMYDREILRTIGSSFTRRTPNPYA